MTTRARTATGLQRRCSNAQSTHPRRRCAVWTSSWAIAERPLKHKMQPFSMPALFFFKQKTAYEIGLGIPAEPLFRSPLPPETELSRQMTTSTTSIDIMGLQAAYANLHTDQERDYFMQRYHDVISSFGGKTSYDADNRPLLVMRSNLWASGYDVDGTDQTSLGQ